MCHFSSVSILFVYLNILSVSTRRHSPATTSCSQYSNSKDSFSDTGDIIRGYGSPPLARLGNHLFMYASAFGVAHSNRFDLHHRPWPEDKEPNIFKLFNIEPNFTPLEDNKPFTVLAETKGTPLQFEPACLYLTPNRYALSGYRQSFKYFNHVEIETKLRDTLKFRNSSLEYFARSFLVQMNGTATKGGSSSLEGRRQIVGIHVRYGMTGHRAFGGCLPSPSYYLRAVDYFRKQYKNVIFVYAAEPIGMKWFEDEVIHADPFNGYDMFPITTNDPIETFAILSHCDASIYSFGSYGWFVAWLANGPVVYSRHLATRPRNCEVLNRGGIKDFIPPSWTGI